MPNCTVVYVGGFELPDRNAAAHRVLANAKILRQLGLGVVLVGVDRSIGGCSVAAQLRAPVDGFDNWAIPYPSSAKEWMAHLCSVDPIVKIVRHYPDVRAIFCYNYPAIALSRLKEYCHRCDIKVVADCTEWYSAKGGGILHDILKGIDTCLRMRVVHRRLDGMIVISRYLENYYRGCRSVVTIPPLVDPSEEKWRVDGSGCDLSRVRIVYAGSPGRTKDRLDLVIEALDQIDQSSDYMFDVVGLAKEQYLRDNRRHARVIQRLGARVRFLGRLSHTESLRHVQRADFTALIRDDTRLTRAGFPTKFVESISCGVPVIASRTSDLADYVSEGKNGFLVSTSNPQDVRAALQRAVGLGRPEIEAMKRYCRQNNPFTYDRFIVHMRAFIRDLEICSLIA